jgi:hypothetical protein
MKRKIVTLFTLLRARRPHAASTVPAQPFRDTHAADVAGQIPAVVVLIEFRSWVGLRCVP